MALTLLRHQLYHIHTEVLDSFKKIWKLQPLMQFNVLCRKKHTDAYQTANNCSALTPNLNSIHGRLWHSHAMLRTETLENMKQNGIRKGNYTVLLGKLAGELI